MASFRDCAMAWLRPHAHLERSEVCTFGFLQWRCVHIQPFRRLSLGMPFMRSVVGLLVSIPSWHCEKVVVVMLCLVWNSFRALVAHMEGHSCGS